MAVKLTAEASQFKKEMQAAAKTVKQLGNESKLADSELRKTGNAEQYVQQKTAALSKQIQAQTTVVEKLERAYKAQAEAMGEASEGAQELLSQLNAQRAVLNDLQADLNGVQSGTDRMGKGFKQGKKEAQAMDSVRFQGLTTALSNVSGAIRSVEQAAASAAKSVWQMGKDSASWADTLASDAARYGMDARTLQRWQYAARFVDVEASTVANANNRMLSSMRAGSAAFGELGVQIRTTGGALRDTEDVFWDTVTALGRINDETQRDAYAQELFGKSFAELRPLIMAGRDAWEAYGDEAERAGLVMGGEQLDNLNSFNDSLDRMGASFDALKYNIFAGLASGLQEISDTVVELTQAFLEWLNTAEGKDVLRGFADAIKNLVQSLADGGLENLLRMAIDLFGKLSDLAKWAANNANWAVPTAAGGGLLLDAGGKVLEVATMVISAKALHALSAAGSGAGAAGAGAGAAGGAAGAAGAAAETASAAAETATAAATTAKAAAESAAMTGAIPGLGVTALGFSLGIASVLGVGLLAKAMAGPAFNSDDLYAGGYERYEKSGMGRDMEELTQTARGIGETLAGDYRTDRRNRLTAEDVTDAINAAKIPGTTVENNYNVDNDNQSHIQVTAQLTGEAWDVGIADGKITKDEFRGIQRYVTAFGVEVLGAQQKLRAGWAGVVKAANDPDEEILNAKPTTDTEMAAFVGMTSWIQDNVQPDQEAAIRMSAGLWAKMVGTVSSPEELGIKVSTMTAEEARDSEDATFTALTAWCMVNLSMDYDTAVAYAMQIWEKMGTTVAAPPEDGKTITYTGQGGSSTALTDYVNATMGDDYESAVAAVDAYYAGLDSRMGEGGDGVHGDVGRPKTSAYLEEQVTALSDVYSEYMVLVAELQETLANGGEITLSEEAAGAITDLKRRGDELAGRVSWYETDEYLEGAGALGLAAAGRDWELNAPRAMEHAEAVRQHETEAITKETQDLATAAGLAYQDYLRAVGQFGDASAEAAAALDAYTKAQKKADQAAEDMPRRLEAVERDYAMNIAAITEGGIRATGYGGKGKAVYVLPDWSVYDVGNQATALYGQSVTGGHGYARVNGLGQYAGTEFGEIITQGQADASAQQKALMKAAQRYGSWASFVESMSETDQAAMRAIEANGGSEWDWWQTVRYGAFGDLPDQGYGGAGALGSNVQLVTNAFDMIGAHVPSIVDHMTILDTRLKALTQGYNESIGYNDARGVVEAMAQAGMFTGVDWSTFNGGITEDIVADMADEYIAAGEQIPEWLGTGMERSTELTIFDESTLSAATADAKNAGAMIDSGLAAGIRESIPQIRAAASEAAAAVPDMFEALLRIQSPSKVMEGLGAYVGEGLALGIEGTAQRVARAVDSMVTATTQPVAGYIGRQQGAAANSYSANSSVYVGNYYQNGAEDIDYIGAQLADMQRRQLLGFGHR